MPFSTKVRPCLNCNTNAFSLALFWELNCLFVVWGNVTTECIMQITNEVISISFIEWHECTTHYNKLNFIDIVTNFLKLLHSVSCLNVGVVPCSDGSHRCGFVASIWLSGVLEIRIRASRTVNTDVTSCCDVGTTMRFAHNCHHCDPTCSTHWLCFEQRRELIFIVLWNRTDYLHQLWGFWYFVLPRCFAD